MSVAIHRERIHAFWPTVNRTGVGMNTNSAWDRHGIPNSTYNKDNWPDLDYWIYLRGEIETIHEERQESEYDGYETPRVLCFELEGVAVRCNIQGASQGDSFPLRAGDNVVILGEREHLKDKRWCRANYVQWPDRRLLYVANKVFLEGLRAATPEGIREQKQIGLVQFALIAGFLAYIHAPWWVWTSVFLAVLALVLQLEVRIRREIAVTDIAHIVKKTFFNLEGIGTVEFFHGEDAIFSYTDSETINTWSVSPSLQRSAIS